MTILGPFRVSDDAIEHVFAYAGCHSVGLVECGWIERVGGWLYGYRQHAELRTTLTDRTDTDHTDTDHSRRSRCLHTIATKRSISH